MHVIQGIKAQRQHLIFRGTKTREARRQVGI